MQVIETPSLLIAMPQLIDPNFSRSVVLLLESNQQGSLGFMINKLSPYSMTDLLGDAPEYEYSAEVPSWIGGPVEVEKGLVLHNQAEDREAKSFGSGVHLSSSNFAVENLMNHYDFPRKQKGARCSLYPYRFLLGYAGWGPGQLIEEVVAGSWLQIPFSFDLVFNTHWSEIWNDSLKSLGVDPSEILSANSQDYLI